MHGGQEDEIPFNFKPFLNLKYKAGPDTQSAETTAKITKQHRKQLPDLLLISYLLSLQCVFVCVKEYEI